MKQLLFKKYKQLLFLAALFLVFTMCIGLGVVLMINNTVVINGEDGTWDLHNMNLSNTSGYLQGYVEHIPNALLTPEEFADRESESVFGSIEGIDVVTTRTRIYLPDDGRYTFSSPLIARSSRLYVNGEWYLDVGSLGESRETIILDTTYIVFTATPVDGVVEIVQQFATYLHRWYGVPQGWQVGQQGIIDVVRMVDFVPNLILGYFLAMFLVYIVLYTLQPSYIANLYIATFSLTLFLRSGAMNHGMLSIAPVFADWYARFRIEHLSIPIMAFLFVAVANKLLPGVIPKWFRIIVYILSSTLLSVFLFIDIVLIIQMMPWIYGTYVVIIVYALLHATIVILKDLSKFNLEQAILITGFVGILLAVIYDYDRYLGAQTFPSHTSLPLMSTVISTYFAFSVAIAVFLSNVKAMAVAKAVEQELIVENTALARLNHIKTELMDTISHEARTPLAVLASYSSLVSIELKKKKGNEQMVANLNKIVEEAKRIANLIDSMNKIALNKEKSKKRINLNLGELIEQTAGLYYHIFERNNIEMELSLDNALYVFVSPEELTQVLFNLLQNAKTHTEQGKVSVIAKRKDDKIVVIISDTGTGIPPELLPHLFERGVSSTAHGMGIGLMVCKEIIEAHDGTIAVESKLTGINKGAKITFTLPATRKTNYVKSQ